MRNPKELKICQQETNNITAGECVYYWIHLDTSADIGIIRDLRIPKRSEYPPTTLEAEEPRTSATARSELLGLSTCQKKGKIRKKEEKKFGPFSMAHIE